jgi:RHS repeat-associated protein
MQISTTSTTYYPSKYFSLASTTSGGTSYSTSTNYIWLGDTLLSTIDQKLYNGTATGTSIARYVHPDHLGSTNVVTDASGSIAQLLDYFPYGASRVSSTTYPTNEQREYIGQFADQTGLDYLNARYYDSARGQFLSEDPVFLALGNNDQVRRLALQEQQKLMIDPQQINAYNYSRNNPIINKDPTGNAFGVDDAAGFFGGGFIGAASYVGVSIITGQPTTWGGVAGSFFTGGVIGWGLVNTPETLGASNAISASITTGLIGGFYGDVIKQGVDIGTGAQTTPYDPTASQVNALYTAGAGGLTEGVLPNAKITGLTKGVNNYVAIGKSTATKIANGTISNVNLSTGVKAAVGAQASSLYKTLVGLLLDIVRNLSTSQSSQSKK